MNSKDLLGKITTINRYITDSIHSSEKLGLDVFGIVSSFEKDMCSLIESIENFLKIFFLSESNDSKSYLEELSTIRNKIDSSLNSLINLVELSEDIFLCLFGSKSENSTIAQILKISNEIDEILDELSSAATNSSITASQLGNSGGAFSIISKEIQRETSQLSRHFSKMYEIIEENFPELESLREHITRFKDRERLRKGFSDLINDFQSIENQLFVFKKEIDESMDTAKNKIPELLSHLVNQDIFRQQLEHIIEFTNEASKRIKNRDEFKNQGFINFVITISKEIFDAGSEEFLSAFSEVDSKIDDLTASCCVSIKSNLNDFGVYFNSENEKSLKRVTDEIMIITIKNTVFVQEVLENLSSLKGFLSDFDSKISLLLDQIRTSQNIIKRFQTMRILLKAELARLSDILGKKSKDSQEQFENIINSVEHKTKSIKNVIDNLENLYDKNRHKFELYEKLSENPLSEKDLKDIFDSLKKIVEFMEKEYAFLSKEVDKYSSSIVNSKESFVSKYGEIYRLNETTSNFLGEIINSIPKSNFDYKEDEILKELIENMTTYKERIVAQQHLEVEDVGSEGGEFTLF